MHYHIRGGYLHTRFHYVMPHHIHSHHHHHHHHHLESEMGEGCGTAMRKDYSIMDKQMKMKKKHIKPLVFKF